ncbi:MAG: SDR family oxidoreductase [Rhodospirillaceae bacterium]|nr:SDR family oxidoreductase [Rhodospirillaceae bacterium]
MNKSIIVTGGGRGIGAATALLLAKQGYDIAVNYQSNVEAAQAVVRAIAELGRHAIAVQGDVAKEDDVLRLFEAVDERMGPLHGLVNNAGITGKIGRMEDATAATFQTVMDVNVVGALLCAREAVKRLSARRGGSGGVIVNISSVASTLGSANTYVWYAASKAAVDAMTLGLGQEVAREGIRVVGVAAGVTDTELHAAGGLPDRAATVGPAVPLGRAARPEEIAEAVAWLMSDAAGYCTAATLRVGGGR